MTDTFTARAITRAQQALVHRLSTWDGHDPETLAAEYVTALMGDGWRPTEARPGQRPTRAGGDNPTDEYRQARAETERRIRDAQARRKEQEAGA